jgi:hypothetical protein
MDQYKEQNEGIVTSINNIIIAYGNMASPL